MEALGEVALSPLEQLIDRAQLASERMGRKNPHRILLQEMAIVIVSQARLIATMTERLADKPRIILPSERIGPNVPLKPLDAIATTGGKVTLR